MKTKKKPIKKKRYWVTVYREIENDCLDIGAYAYPSKQEAIFHQNAGCEVIKTISFTL